MKPDKLLLILVCGLSVILSSAVPCLSYEDKVEKAGERLWKAIEEHHNRIYNTAKTVDAVPMAKSEKNKEAVISKDVTNPKEELPSEQKFAADSMMPTEKEINAGMKKNKPDTKNLSAKTNANNTDANSALKSDKEDIRKQTFKDITQNQKIDQAFQDAKSIDQNRSVKNIKVDETETPLQPVMTASQVIGSVIPDNIKDKRIDLDLENTTLADILMTLSETANMNIVLDPALKNNQLDLHLKKVTVEEALLLMAGSYNLGFDHVGTSLYVTNKDKLIKKNLVTKVIKLKHINVQEAETLVKDIVQSVSASNELNSMILVGDPDEVVNAENIIKGIDLPQPQVILEAKIIEVNKDALKDIGVDWSDQINLSYQESGRPVDFDDIEKAPGSPIEIFSIARNPVQLNTVIKMLENQNKAKVLSNPRVTTLNNQKAEIFVGDEIPYTITNVTGGVVTTDVRWVEPGIRLAITPSIIENNFVVMRVEPEVSFIYAFRGPNDQYPQIKTRKAAAYVRIKNNEPFVLGGLLSQEDKKNLYKVPMLGNIPLLGNLFSYEKHSVTDTELIITIIPSVVHGTM